MEAKDTLERLKVRRLRHTSRTPGEWIGMLTDGRALYINAQHNRIQASIGDTLMDALVTAKNNNGQFFRHNSYEKASLGTDEMLEFTGLNFNDTKELIVGDLTCAD